MLVGIKLGHLWGTLLPAPFQTVIGLTLLISKCGNLKAGFEGRPPLLSSCPCLSQCSRPLGLIASSVTSGAVRRGLVCPQPGLART